MAADAAHALCFWIRAEETRAWLRIGTVRGDHAIAGLDPCGLGARRRGWTRLRRIVIGHAQLLPAPHTGASGEHAVEPFGAQLGPDAGQRRRSLRERSGGTCTIHLMARHAAKLAETSTELV